MIDDDVLLALRRSTLRYRVLLLLATAGPCYHGLLAAHLGVNSRRLSEVLFGGSPDYPTSRSLVPLGLIAVEERNGRRRYNLTDLGRAVLAAIETRREELKLPRLPA